jgi:hypothetical protein
MQVSRQQVCTADHTASLTGGQRLRHGLGLALSYVDDRPTWGHTGPGTHTELWHLPRENVTIAVAWNDDAVDSEAPFVADLLPAVLGEGLTHAGSSRPRSRTTSSASVL